MLPYFRRSNSLAVDLRIACPLCSKLIDGIFDPIGYNRGWVPIDLNSPTRGPVGSVPVTLSFTVVMVKLYSLATEDSENHAIYFCYSHLKCFDQLSCIPYLCKTIQSMGVRHRGEADDRPGWPFAPFSLPRRPRRRRVRPCPDHAAGARCRPSAAWR